MTAYTITPVGLGGRLLHGKAERIEGWDLRLIEENERLRCEVDDLRRVAAGAQRLSERLESESALRVKAQSRLHRVAAALASVTFERPDLFAVVNRVRVEIWRDGDV